MLDTASPLASIYTTSTMEHHHFNQTVTILQQVRNIKAWVFCTHHVPGFRRRCKTISFGCSQEGHNIFAKLSSEEYKQVLGNIKHCILATDLANFFPNKAKLNDIVEKGVFSWTIPDHR